MLQQDVNQFGSDFSDPKNKILVITHGQVMKSLTSTGVNYDPVNKSKEEINTVYKLTDGKKFKNWSILILIH